MLGRSRSQRVHHHRVGIFPGEITDLGRLVPDGRYVDLINSVRGVIGGNQSLKLPDFHQHIDVVGIEAGVAIEGAIDLPDRLVGIAAAIGDLDDGDDEVDAVTEQTALVGRVRWVRGLS